MLLAVASMGCNRNRVSPSSVEGQIGHAIQQRCRGISNCTIRLRDVTSFDWDKMFYFDSTVPPAEREREVGVQLKSEELRRQLVFLRGGSVIRNDLLPTDIERPIENEIAFDDGNQANRLSCDSDAQFLAQRERRWNGHHVFPVKVDLGGPLSINPHSAQILDEGYDNGNVAHVSAARRKCCRGVESEERTNGLDCIGSGCSRRILHLAHVLRDARNLREWCRAVRNHLISVLPTISQPPNAAHKDYNGYIEHGSCPAHVDRCPVRLWCSDLVRIVNY